MEILDLKGYSIYKSTFIPVGSNMYILISGYEALLFDAIESEDVIELLRKNNVNHVHIFLTHEHYDHSHGVLFLKKHFNTTLYCHEGCKGFLSTKKRSSPRLVSFVLSVMDMKDGGSRHEDFMKKCDDYDLDADVYLRESSVLKINDHKICIIHVPGHTPGSILYILDDTFVFSGDSMIYGNQIITGFRGGNKEDLQRITLPKLKVLSDDLIVMPGHGDFFHKGQFDFNIY